MARFSISLTMILMLGSSICAQTKQVTLPEALLSVAQKYHVSVLGELSNPVPQNVYIALDKTSDPAQAVAEIVAQAPGYEWFKRGHVFLIAQKKLYKAPGNPMNWKIERFSVFGDLSLFKLRFPTAVVNPRSHLLGEGIEGFGLPPQLSPPLKQETFRNMIAREILIRVASEIGNLYSDLILPSPNPPLAYGHLIFLAWDIAGGPGLSKSAVQSKSYPTKFAERETRRKARRSQQ